MPLLYLLIYEKYDSGKHCAKGCVVASFGEKFNKHFGNISLILALVLSECLRHWQRVDIIN